MEVNITEEKFKAYRELQNSGEINMLDYINGCKLTGLSKEEYIDIVIKQLELLREEIVIHRITSDPDKDSLIEPTWLLKKFCLLNDIDKEMKKRDTYQGKYTK